MLEIGTKAPAFSLQDQNGEVHSLSDYKGQKVILYFYPKDMTGGGHEPGVQFPGSVSAVPGERRGGVGCQQGHRGITQAV